MRPMKAEITSPSPPKMSLPAPLWQAPALHLWWNWRPTKRPGTRNGDRSFTVRLPFENNKPTILPHILMGNICFLLLLLLSFKFTLNLYFGPQAPRICLERRGKSKCGRNPPVGWEWPLQGKTIKTNGRKEDEDRLEPDLRNRDGGASAREAAASGEAWDWPPSQRRVSDWRGRPARAPSWEELLTRWNKELKWVLLWFAGKVSSGLDGFELLLQIFAFKWIRPSLSNSSSVSTNTLQSKGRAVSRLLESFAADEGFQMDGSSFSEEDDSSHRQKNNKSPEGRKKILFWQSFQQWCVSVLPKCDIGVYLFLCSSKLCPDQRTFNRWTEGVDLQGGWAALRCQSPQPGDPWHVSEHSGSSAVIWDAFPVCRSTVIMT